MNLTDEQYIEIGQQTTALVHNIFDGIYSTAEQETGSDIDFYPWMTKLQEWQRLHEKTDRETLMGIFRRIRVRPRAPPVVRRRITRSTDPLRM